VGIEDDEFEERELRHRGTDEFAHRSTSHQSERVAFSGVDDHGCLGEKEVLHLGPGPSIDHIGVGVLQAPDPGVVHGGEEEFVIDHNANATSRTMVVVSGSGWMVVE